MSASAAARQRLQGLLDQHKRYTEKLRQQEDELRRLQVQVAQTRTVVEMTLPSELKKARREVLNTTEPGQRGDELQAVKEAMGAGWLVTSVRDLLGPVVSAVSGSIWVQVLIILISILVAGLLSGVVPPPPPQQQQQQPVASGAGVNNTKTTPG